MRVEYNTWLEGRTRWILAWYMGPWNVATQVYSYFPRWLGWLTVDRGEVIWQPVPLTSHMSFAPFPQPPPSLPPHPYTLHAAFIFSSPISSLPITTPSPTPFKWTFTLPLLAATFFSELYQVYNKAGFQWYNNTVYKHTSASCPWNSKTFPPHILC